MLTVPRDGCRKALREIRVLGDPSQLAAQLRSVNRAAAVVAWTVRDQVVRISRQSQRTQNLAHDLEVGALAIRAHHVALPYRSAREDGPDGGAAVIHMDPVAHVEAGPMHALPLIRNLNDTNQFGKGDCGEKPVDKTHASSLLQ